MSANHPTPNAPNARVLGAGAGGGSPQWNCNCTVCRRVRAGEAPRRTQTSLAVTADGQRWAVINASPDLREQIAQTPPLQPQRPGRHSPIDAVVLTGAEVDQVGGLLTMREGEPFSLYASENTHSTLDESSIFDVLDGDQVPRRQFPADEAVELVDAHDQPMDITVEAFAVPGKIPLYRETPGQTPEIGETTGDNVALDIQLGSARLLFIPCCADITDWLKKRIDGADILLFDGTLFDDDELIDAGLAEKTGRRMGHVSISGDDGVLQQLDDVDVGPKVLIHLNNSNPVLLDDTAQRRQVEDAGWEVAFDGMELLTHTMIHQ